MIGHKVNALGLRLGVVSKLEGSVSHIGGPEIRQDFVGYDSCISRDSNFDEPGQILYNRRYVRTQLVDRMLSAGQIVNRIRIGFNSENDATILYIDYYNVLENIKAISGSVPIDETYTQDLISSDLEGVLALDGSLDDFEFYYKSLKPDMKVRERLTKQSQRVNFKGSADFLRVCSIINYVPVAVILVTLLKKMIKGTKRQSRDLRSVHQIFNICVLESDNINGIRLEIHGPLDGKDRTELLQMLAGHVPLSNRTDSIDSFNSDVKGADGIIGIKLMVFYV
jgi:hypothetical protein